MRVNRCDACCEVYDDVLPTKQRRYLSITEVAVLEKNGVRLERDTVELCPPCYDSIEVEVADLNKKIDNAVFDINIGRLRAVDGLDALRKDLVESGYCYIGSYEFDEHVRPSIPAPLSVEWVAVTLL